MSAKKSTGNRWANAVEGAADVLLEAGKSTTPDLVEEPEVEKPVVTPQAETLPAKKPRRKPPINKNTQPPASSSKQKAKIDASKEPLSTASITPPLDEGIPVAVKNDTSAAEKTAPEVSESEKLTFSLDDPIQQALTKKGRKKGGGRQRTYYIDNDIADKITTLAQELEKSESQLLREVLRAVLKM